MILGDVGLETATFILEVLRRGGTGRVLRRLYLTVNEGVNQLPNRYWIVRVGTWDAQGFKTKVEWNTATHGLVPGALTSFTPPYPVRYEAGSVVGLQVQPVNQPTPMIGLQAGTEFD